jgi:hypothetical protein
LREKLESVAKEAVENDPRRLKARIAELERGGAASTAQVEAAEKSGYERGWRCGYERGRKELAENFLDRLGGVRADHMQAVHAVGDVFARFLNQLEPILLEQRTGIAPLPSITVENRQKPPAPSRLPRDAAGSSPGDTTPMPAQRRILDALAELEAIGFSPARRDQVGFLAAISPKSGNFGNYLGALRTGGYIEYPNPGSVALTAAGRAVAEPQSRPLNTEELQNRIKAKLQPALRRLLDVVIKRHPHAIDRQALGAEVGLSAASGNFGNYLGRLHRLGLVDYPSPRRVIAAPVLFLGAANG